MRTVLATCALLCLAACDPYALQRRQAATATWIGREEAELVRVAGVPARTFESGGHRFLAYEEGSLQIVPTYVPGYPWRYGIGGYGYGGAFPADVVQRVCETTFEVADGRIVGFTLRGNACG